MNQTGYGNPAQHHFPDNTRELRASARPRLDNIVCLEYLHNILSVAGSRSVAQPSKQSLINQSAGPLDIREDGRFDEVPLAVWRASEPIAQ